MYVIVFNVPHESQCLSSSLAHTPLPNTPGVRYPRRTAPLLACQVPLLRLLCGEEILQQTLAEVPHPDDEDTLERNASTSGDGAPSYVTEKRPLLQHQQ